MSSIEEFIEKLNLSKDSPFDKILTEYDVVLPWEKVKEKYLSTDQIEIHHAILTTLKEFYETFPKINFNSYSLGEDTRKVYIVGLIKREGEWLGRRGRKFKYRIDVQDAITGDYVCDMKCPEIENEWNTMFSRGCIDLSRRISRETL